MLKNSPILAAALYAAFSLHCQAATTLSGLELLTTDATGRAATAGGGTICTTQPGGGPAKIWVTAGGIDDPFINGPANTQSFLDRPLPVGTHRFGFYCQAGAESTYFGLNLFFNGVGATPRISVFAPLYRSASAPLPSFASTAGPTLNLTGALVAGANTLSFVEGVTTISLTSYHFALPTVRGKDRVNTQVIAPDGRLDFVGEFTIKVTSSLGTGLRFVPVAPCRIADTREANLGAFGQPAIGANTTRSFAIPQRTDCGIPVTAAAYSLNVTVVPQGPLGYVTVWPTGLTQPLVSTLNSLDGRIKANAALVPAGANGSIDVFVTNATHLVLDINGYFVDPSQQPQSLAFYPLPPCRVMDTRNANGALGGPVIAAGAPRSVPIISSNCGVPASAQAYSLNATVVPSGPLGFLTLWPTGQGQPTVSTLNSLGGGIVANAAIVPAGTNGSINAFMSGQSHLVLDINGYFAPAGAANAQRFFAAVPCRLLDTREAASEFGGPVLAAGQSRSYRLPLVTNCGLPVTASAYSLNATVVPTATLGYLTLWPFGSGQPFVSTLNALNDTIVANAAIVPAGTQGAVASFVTDETHLILDTNGYFAP